MLKTLSACQKQIDRFGKILSVSDVTASAGPSLAVGQFCWQDTSFSPPRAHRILGSEVSPSVSEDGFHVSDDASFRENVRLICQREDGCSSHDSLRSITYTERGGLRAGPARLGGFRLELCD